MENKTIHPCTQYALDVVEGRLITGHSEYLACKRHLDDLERQKDSDFPFRFDEEKANRVYDFFGYCNHIEGDPKLIGTPIRLAPFQQFILGNIFGWVYKDTGYRRFEKAFILMGRKNAKSTLASGMSLYFMVGEKEESPKVYCAAVDREQAHVVFDIASAMAKKSPDIAKRLNIKRARIEHRTRGGVFMPWSKETKNKDAFNPSAAFVDEYHAHTTSMILDLLESARGHRPQYVIIIISTAGVNAEDSPCFKEYLYCKSILNGSNENDRYFIYICELDKDDDEHDPKVWVKANPLIATMPEGMRILQNEHDEAFDSQDPSKIRTFRIKRLNRWVYDSDDGYAGALLEKWDDYSILPIKKSTPAERRAAFVKLTEGSVAIYGADLSKSIDLTADAFLFYLPDQDKIAFCAHGYLPEGAITRHEKTDKIPYRDWITDGWVSKTEGDVTDYEVIIDNLFDRAEKYHWIVLEVAYDPWNGTFFATSIAKKGLTCVEIRQGVQTLSEPTKLFRTMVTQGKIVHDGSPLLKMAFANAKVITDNNGNIKLSKEDKDDRHRIDPLAALINAMVRLAALKEGPKESIYNKRGIRTL
jgi:Phage terminase-like protein, large subunit